MSKIRVSELKCFGSVERVIGRERAEIELFKVVSVDSGALFVDEERLGEAFIWMRTPQGSQFWHKISRGVNHYDN